MVKAFISYSHNDEIFVNDLHRQIESNNVKTWIDWRDISVAEPWRQAIYDGILECTHFIPILSPSYLASETCRMESYLALVYGKIILPIMYQNCYQEAAQFPETKHLPDIRHMDYTQDNIYGKTMTDSERLQNILAVLRDEIPRRPDCMIYLAFPSSEIEFATRIWNDLEANGIATWMTNQRYYIGEDWNKVHWDGLRTAKVFLPILTPQAARSFYMKKEVLLARTLKLPMIPLIAPSTADVDELVREMGVALKESYEMYILSELNWIMPKSDYELMFQQLKRAIEQQLKRLHL